MGTGNSEVILDRKVADKRVFPAMDILRSGTRKEELLVKPDLLKKTYVLRRILNPMGTGDFFGTLARNSIFLRQGRSRAMSRCETCGNDYDKAFEVVIGGQTHCFDSFECAIHALAPVCSACGIRIVGHGLERAGEFYCCAHCAEEKGATGLRDRG